MAVNYSKIFTVTDAITSEPVTIFVETIDPIGGEPLVVIKTLEGDYGTLEEFQDAREYTIKGLERGYMLDKGEIKLYSSITLMLPDTRQLVETLKEVLVLRGGLK